jgi:hypothetical protein
MTAVLCKPLSVEAEDIIYPLWDHQPYYIVTPSYVRTSAGIKVLHMLAHSLNRKGYRTWLIIHPYQDARSVSPDLTTPLLTDEIIDAHHKQGLNPVVVYPETISGNPFNATCVARYILNYPGLLGGDTMFDEDEYCFGYTQSLAEASGQTNRVLFIPASDPAVFYPPPAGTVRQGTCYYWGKFQEHHQGTTFGVPSDSIEISRRYPDKQGPKEIAEILRRVERLYVFENTALAIEAILCECPVVFMPNPYLTEVIAAQEMGWDGMAWGDSLEEIQRATHTVEQAAINYLQYYKIFWRSLEQFIKDTQVKASESNPKTRILVPDLVYANYLSQDMISVKQLKGLFSYSAVTVERAKTSTLAKALFQRIRREILRPFKKIFRITN